MSPQEQKKKLDDIAKRMKTAKGKELDALVAEIDRVIGFDTGDSKYDPEALGAWETKNAVEAGLKYSETSPALRLRERS